MLDRLLIAVFGQDERLDGMGLGDAAQRAPPPAIQGVTPPRPSGGTWIISIVFDSPRPFCTSARLADWS